MLTKIRIKNFKRFDEVEFDLGKNVVLIGPNNSGKTTALQSLALWDIGVKKWIERRGSGVIGQRSGVTINRRDIVSIPIPEALLLWRNLHVRNSEKTKGKSTTQNVRMEICVEGINNGEVWKCGLEFDYANTESFYCRPLFENGSRMPIPEIANSQNLAYLPPMSGLADREFLKELGELNVLIGQGQTAQVLRNLCLNVFLASSKNKDQNWDTLVNYIGTLFGVVLLPPKYITERSEITMSYKQHDGKELDISTSGRGLQQTLLLLSYLYSNPNSILLLDEPDAHLEVLRQRQIYQVITELAEQQHSQVIAASHSEIILNEAAGKDMVVAFVGKPHRIDGRSSQLLKSLNELGYDQYYQAEQKGWVLYLEGSTDLSILKTFARILDHPVLPYLDLPFVHFVGTNIPEKARSHFYGLKEAKNDLVGIAIFDRIDKEINSAFPLKETMWKKRELENYFLSEKVLIEYAKYDTEKDLFGYAEANKRSEIMGECIKEISDAIAKLKRIDPWSDEIKASDEFFDPLFELYFDKLKTPNLLRKNEYYNLASLVKKDDINPEIIEKLDLILEVAKAAKPMI
jgi:energy-coupling factor transporter ATP-binding protein EcfA2